MFGGIRDGRLMPRPVALAILAAALLLRVLIPTGWMPAHAADGSFGITLCTPSGVSHAWVDAEGKIHDKQPHKKSSADQPCAFAGLAMAGDVPMAAIGLPLTVQAVASHHPLSFSVGIGHGLAAPPPPSTGPPAFA